MKLKHFLLALIPVAGLLVFALGRSATQFRALIDLLPSSPAVESQAALPPEPDLLPSETKAAAGKRVGAPGPDESSYADSEEPAAPAPPLPMPSYDYVPPQPNDEFGYAQDGPAGVPHPEVTDPRMRRMLEPAWAD